LDVDYLLLSPTEDVAVANITGGTADSIFGYLLTTPPARLGAPTSDPVWIAGVVNGTMIFLGAALAAAGWGTNAAGLFTGTGITRHTIGLTGYFSSISGTATVKFQIANITDATIAATVTKTSANGPWNPTLSFTDVAGKVYQPRVTVTAGSGTFGYFVQTLTHSVPAVITQNQKVRTDPGSVPARYTAEQLNSSSAIVVQMNATRVPFWIPPGLSLLVMDCWDQLADSNDLELSHFNARTLSVSPAVYPRNWV
jgi:hypothetical protein